MTDYYYIRIGLKVDCYAVERPNVRIKDLRELAFSLGAHDFQVMSYHP
jgi:hypothetical protein